MLFAVLMHSRGNRGDNAFINVGSDAGHCFCYLYFGKKPLHQRRHEVDNDYQHGQKQEHDAHPGKH